MEYGTWNLKTEQLVYLLLQAPVADLRLNRNET